MCGFAGAYSHDAVFDESFRRKFEKVGNAIRHRGPDDSGVWLDESIGIGLVHRRLSIQDVSASGSQPMISPSGRM